MIIKHKITGKVIFDGDVSELSGANLHRADLEDANLYKANLEGANLEGADLEGADLYKANLRGADLFRANLSDANLSYANLEGANLFRANLSDANLSYANLEGANLINANLTRANLRGADLFRADLDFSSGIPLWCGGLNVKLDDKLIKQQLYHLIINIKASQSSDIRINNIISNKEIVELCNESHIINEYELKEV